VGTTYKVGECERNERREWCHEVDTHGVSELVSH
jgi:hypothetical protein